MDYTYLINPEEKEAERVEDLLGQPSGKFDYKVLYTEPPHASIPLESIIPTGWGPDFEEQDRQKEDMNIDMDWDEFTDDMTIDWDFFIDEMDLDDLPAPSDNDCNCMMLDLNDFIE